MRLFLLCCLCLSSGPLVAQQRVPLIDSLFQTLRPAYAADSAFAHTAYVAQWWRWPGNAGFDSSIHYVRAVLERAGFRDEAKAPENARLTYRLERHPREGPAWEPVSAAISYADRDGVDLDPLLSFPANRNLIAINSFSTPPEGVEAELVYAPDCSAAALKALDVKGKIVLGDCHPYLLFRRAVLEGGAAGVLSYQIPPYNQPERYPDHIPFRGIPYQPDRKAWCLNLSLAARNALRERLAEGPVRLRVAVATRFYAADELVLIADIRGEQRPEERVVLSAHVQEPGANDNASGVGCLAEVARVTARLAAEKSFLPARTLTFIWGDEIDAPRRYLEEDKARAEGIVVGLSLDMVGEDTEQTGGAFLIEKMPDPSAIWTRGEDRHTEWGAANLDESDFFPHYFNDLLIYICRRQGAHAGWTVRTNPFEGGSDHQPFLDAGIPGALFWHFTDVFYHTDGDRIDKVSPLTLYNVGVSAAVSALAIASADAPTAEWLTRHLRTVAAARLEAEFRLSAEALEAGTSSRAREKRILAAWGEWYAAAIATVERLPVIAVNPGLKALIDQEKATVEMLTGTLVERLGKGN